MREPVMGVRPRRLPIYMLLAANGISMVGNVLSMLAIPWFVLQTTGSASKTGLTAFFTILPVVIAAFFGGAFVDRLGYKWASVSSDVASSLAVALIPLLYAVDLLPFWLLLVLVFIGSLLDAPGTTAREALIPDLAELAAMPIERASSAIQVVERGSRLLGAPLGGVLIAAIGPVNLLWLNAATFVVSAVMVAAIIPTTSTAKVAAGSSYLGELRDGLGFIHRDPLTLAIVVTLMITNFLDAAKSSVILPVYVRDVYGSAVALGLLFAASGGGAVVGALIYGAIGHRWSRRRVFVGAFIVVSLPSLVLALQPPVAVAILAQAVMGLAAGPLNPILSTVQYERVPAHMRGRVFGAITAGAFLGMPLGGLVAGYMLDAVGLRVTLLATGGCYLLTTLSLTLNRSLRHMDAAASPGEDARTASVGAV